MASWQQIAERYENALSENYETVREHFDSEIQTATSAIENLTDEMVNLGMISNKEIIADWKKFKSKMEDMKQRILSKMITP